MGHGGTGRPVEMGRGPVGCAGQRRESDGMWSSAVKGWPHPPRRDRTQLWQQPFTGGHEVPVGATEGGKQCETATLVWTGGREGESPRGSRWQGRSQQAQTPSPPGGEHQEAGWLLAGPLQSSAEDGSWGRARGQGSFMRHVPSEVPSRLAP